MGVAAGIHDAVVFGGIRRESIDAFVDATSGGFDSDGDFVVAGNGFVFGVGVDEFGLGFGVVEVVGVVGVGVVGDEVTGGGEYMGVGGVGGVSVSDFGFGVGVVKSFVSVSVGNGEFESE